MKRKKTVIIAAILMASVSLVVVSALLLLEKPEKATLKIMEDKVDLQIKDVHYTEIGDSGAKWEITADAARYMKRENLALFEKLTVRMTMGDGRTFLMSGDSGRFHTDSRDMDIEGNVGIVSGNGEHLATDRLRYKNAVRQIETDRPVAMETGSLRITGVGMIFDLDEKKISLLSRVRANSEPAEQGK